MAALVLAALGFALVCLGLGLLLAGIALAVFFGLLLVGALSTSALVGLQSRSAANGAKAFGLLLAGGLGLPIGAAGFWLLSRLAHISVATGPALVLGGAGGTVAGVLTAYAAGWAGRQVVTYAGRTLRPH